MGLKMWLFPLDVTLKPLQETRWAVGQALHASPRVYPGPDQVAGPADGGREKQEKAPGAWPLPRCPLSRCHILPISI